MTDPSNIAVKPLKRFHAAPSPDGKGIVLLFEDVTGQTFGGAFATEQAGAFLSLVMEAAAASGANESFVPGEITARPVMASGMAISQGRSPTEARVTMGIGKVRVPFDLDAATVRNTLRLLEQVTQDVAPKKAN